ncbi:MAG: hypothetical protein ACRC7G_10090 [Beijerinckiaceae bacterium]
MNPLIPFRYLASAGLACGILANATPAAAQYYYQSYSGNFRGNGFHSAPTVVYELSPHQIGRLVTRQGYRPEAAPVYDDEVAVLVATDAAGRRTRLTVDSYSGRIVARRLLDAGKPRQQVAARPADAKAALPKPPLVPRGNAAPLASPAPAKPATRPAQPKPPAQALGTPAAPRRVDIPPPAPLDGPAPVRAPAEAPINSVPPAALE